MNGIIGVAKIFVFGTVLGLGLIGSGISAGVGIALADGTLPDSGTYDELLNIPDPDATLGNFDDDGLQAADVRNSPNPR